MNPSIRAVGAHILCEMLQLHQARDGRHLRVELDELAGSLNVRRSDVRSALSALHRDGLVDLTRMTLTLAGFAVALAVEKTGLAPLRQEHVANLAA